MGASDDSARPAGTGEAPGGHAAPRAPARPRPPLTPAAERALAEAAARREAIDRRTREAPAEKGGRGGLEPTRYDDWENKGIASDF